jgi:hypothetical protein
MMLYYPNADEASSLRAKYDPSLLVYLIRPFVQAWEMAA